MKTQIKENNYYFFWIIAMIAFIVPQVITALAYHRLADFLNDKPIKVQVIDSDVMPPGNLTGITESETNKISLWIKLGAKINN